MVSVDSKTDLRYVRFQVLTAASMKMTVFWDITSCSIVETSVYSTRLHGAISLTTVSSGLR
jgi:hypothetical protein